MQTSSTMQPPKHYKLHPQPFACKNQANPSLWGPRNVQLFGRHGTSGSTIIAIQSQTDSQQNTVSYTQVYARERGNGSGGQGVWLRGCRPRDVAILFCVCQSQRSKASWHCRSRENLLQICSSLPSVLEPAGQPLGHRLCGTVQENARLSCRFRDTWHILRSVQYRISSGRCTHSTRPFWHKKGLG